MDLVLFKWLSIVLLLFLGLVGGFLPLWVDKISKVAVHGAYAFAGGILGAVALVHMLDDASDALDDLGKKFATALGGDDADYPMGLSLFLIGFFLICSIETILHHTLGAHAYDHSGHDHGGQDPALLEQGNGSASNAAGWATLVGLTIHSFFEGVAMGVPDNEYQVGALVIAVAAHKGFAAFANSSVNLPLVQRGQRAWWIGITLWFAFTGPVGMAIGMQLTKNLDSTGTAVITALAAGSVLSVGVTEMLLPALKDAKGLGWKLLAAWLGMLAMSLLAIWA